MRDMHASTTRASLNEAGNVSNSQSRHLLIPTTWTLLTFEYQSDPLPPSRSAITHFFRTSTPTRDYVRTTIRLQSIAPSTPRPTTWPLRLGAEMVRWEDCPSSSGGSRCPL